MRILVTAMLMILGASAEAKVVDSPELPTRFFNAVPDVCFSVARGHPPMEGSGRALILEPAPAAPVTVKEHFPRITTWHRLKSQPENVFVGTGDRPGACHLILANTTQTAAVQRVVMGFMGLTGNRILSASAPGAAMTDMLYAKEAPDGYMVVSLQGPRETLRSGEGDQGAVHVMLISKAEFEAMLSPAMPPKPLPANPHPPIPRRGGVSFHDYPSAALRNGWEGTVHFRLGIDGTGKVVDCRITESSGYPILDQAACQNARIRPFDPATNAKGNGIAATWADKETFSAPK